MSGYPATSLQDLTIKPDVIARTVADEMILLDLESGTYFTLNAVGTFVWRGLERGASLDVLVEEVTDEFTIDAETAATDVAAFLESVLAAGLITT